MSNSTLLKKQKSEKYIVVEQDSDDDKKNVKKDVKDIKDSKTDIPSVPSIAIPRLKQLLNGAGKHGNGKFKPIRTKIWISADTASSSGVAYSTVINVRPSLSAEFASFAALWDFFKVHGGALHFGVWATGQTNAVVDVDGVTVYDPADNTAYSSIITALPAGQKFGPFSITAMTDSSVAGSTARTVAPVPTSRTGLYKFKFQCPKGGFSVTGNNQQIVTGQWCSTNISNTQGDYGYIKPIISAAGSTVIDFRYYLEMDVTFSNRT